VELVYFQGALVKENEFFEIFDVYRIPPSDALVCQWEYSNI